MTEPINFDKEQCLKWLDNININPITGKDLDITKDFSLYRKIARQVLKHNIPVNTNVLNDVSKKPNEKIIEIFNNLIDMKQIEYDEMPRALTPELKKKSKHYDLEKLLS